MPHENYHSCDIDTGLKVLGSQKRSHKGKPYTVRIGRKKGKSSGSSEHSYLYPIGSWSKSEASNHCKDHGGRFIAATKKAQEFSNKYGLE